MIDLYILFYVLKYRVIIYGAPFTRGAGREPVGLPLRQFIAVELTQH